MTRLQLLNLSHHQMLQQNGYSKLAQAPLHKVLCTASRLSGDVCACGPISGTDRMLQMMQLHGMLLGGRERDSLHVVMWRLYVLFGAQLPSCRWLDLRCMPRVAQRFTHSHLSEHCCCFSCLLSCEGVVC